MRLACFLFLVTFVGVMGLFVYQNNHSETVTLFNRTWEVGFPTVVGLAYMAGMFSGWFVVGLLKRSWWIATERRAT